MKESFRSIKYRNNPLNIRYSVNNAWLGQTKSDRGFCTFESPYFGIRASLCLFNTYINIYNLDTVSKFISRWAPPSENKTVQYIKFVELFLDRHFVPKRWLDFSNYQQMYELFCSMCIMENNLDFPMCGIGSTFMSAYDSVKVVKQLKMF